MDARVSMRGVQAHMRMRGVHAQPSGNVRGFSASAADPPREGARAPRMYKQQLLEAARRSGSDLAHVGKEGLGPAGASAGRVVATVTVRNPACGDQVRFDLAAREVAAGVGEGRWRVEAAWHDPRGCVVCQASSQLLREAAVGMELRELSGAVEAAGPVLDGAAAGGGGSASFASFRLFHDCGAVGSGRRHCAILPLEAAAQAAARALESVYEQDPS